jgi:hypothetical protein
MSCLSTKAWSFSLSAAISLEKHNLRTELDSCLGCGKSQLKYSRFRTLTALEGKQLISEVTGLDSP